MKTLMLLLCLFATLFISSSGQVTERRVKHVLEGTSMNVQISCEIITPYPLWQINDSVYDLNNIKLPYITSSNNFHTILIPQVSLCLNDTTFQCLPSELMNYNRRYTQMIVLPLSGNVKALHNEY